MSNFVGRLGEFPGAGQKAPVVVATTAPITLSGSQIIASVTVTTGDRVLVKDQVSAAENAIYTVNSAGPWERSTDFNNQLDIVNGTKVLNAADGREYYVTFTGIYDPGTTDITWTYLFDSIAIGDSLTVGDQVTLNPSITLDGADTGNPFFRIQELGATRAYWQWVDASNKTVFGTTIAGGSIEFQTDNQVPVLTLDSSLNAAFQGNINAIGTAFNFGDATSNIYVDVEAGSTSSGGFRIYQNTTLRAYMEYSTAAGLALDSDGDIELRPFNAVGLTLNSTTATFTGTTIQLDNATSPQVVVNNTLPGAITKLVSFSTAGVAGTTSAHPFNLQAGGLTILRLTNATGLATFDYDLNIDGNVTIGDGTTATPTLLINGSATGQPFINMTQNGLQRAWMQYGDAADRLIFNTSLTGSGFEFRPDDTSDYYHMLLTTFKAGNYTFDVDQAVGVGQDNYVLTYDNATGNISLEVSSASAATYIYTLQTGTTYTASANDFVVASNTGTVTITLPAGHSVNDTIIVKKTGATGTVTVDGNASETIDGALTYALTMQYDSVTLISDGTNWLIV